MDILKVYKDFKEAAIDLKLKITRGISIESIMSYFNMELDYLVSILLMDKSIDNNFLFDVFRKYYEKNKINDNRVLIISDTHIGSKVENFAKIYMAYNYAIQKNISNVLHLGDVIQGCTHQENIKDAISEQIRKVRNFYQQIPYINTYFIDGNHEYNLLYYGKVNFKNQISDLSNLKWIGRENSYVSLVDNDLIRLNHEIPMLKDFEKLILSTNLVLEGHHHIWDINDSNVSLPALCDLPLTTGFSELETLGNFYIIRSTLFDNLGNISYVENPILKRSYQNR